MGYLPVGAYVPPALRTSPPSYPQIPNLPAAALNKLLDNNLCVIAGKFEAGYRKLNLLPLATLVMAGRRFAGCSPNLPDDIRKIQPPLPFQGGQCSGVLYNIGLSWIINSDFFEIPAGSRITGSRSNIPGAIIGVGWSPAAGRWKIYYSNGNQDTSLNLTNGNYPEADLIITGITRSDGQPDTCGDPPGPEPVYPPPIDLPPAPDPGDTIFNQTTVDVDIDIGGVNVQVSVDVGDITFDVAGLKVEIGEIKFQISPSFGIGVDDGSPDIGDLDRIRDDINSLGNELDIVGNDIEGVKEKLETQYSGSISWVDCEGNTFSEGYDGLGLDGIISAIKAQNSVNNQGDATVCPIELQPPTPVPSVLLRRQTYGIENETGFPTQVPANARFIEVVIESGNIDQYLYKGIAPDSKQGRFGLFFWGWGDPTDIRWSSPEHIYFEKTIFRIPSDLSSGLYYRISSHPGFTIASYDSGIR